MIKLEKLEKGEFFEDAFLVSYRYNKPITITQRQLMEAQAHVMANGKFMRIAKERDPQMGAMLVLTVAPIMADLVSELFKDSISDIVKEEEK